MIGVRSQGLVPQLLQASPRRPGVLRAILHRTITRLAPGDERVQWQRGRACGAR
jgi:hypothetical protein